MPARSVGPVADVEYHAAIEYLRYTLRVKRGAYDSMKDMAAALGLDPEQLRAFLRGEKLTKSLWDAVDPLSLNDPGACDAGGVGLAIITSTVPVRLRGRVREAVVDAVLDEVKAARVTPPRWLINDWNLRGP